MKRLTCCPSNWLIAATLLFVSTTACHQISPPEATAVLVTNKNSIDPFKEYWYSGEAELNTYELQQMRYGEMRTGKAVLLYVTEDFSKSKHVKLDNPEKDWKDKVSVLKLNNLRRFVTGIYDYSMMESVFTPVDLSQYPHTLKTTTTSQDWCGHTFTQLNFEGGKYRFRQFSYFESEGDEDIHVRPDMLEDEIWTRLRIQPEALVTDEIDLLPGTFFIRFNHAKPTPKKARIRLEQTAQMNRLIIEYLHLNRSLIIGYEPQFPYKVLMWEEYDDGQLTSRAQLIQTLKAPYWQLHDNDDLPLRDSLQLSRAFF